jgi:alpha-glucosidase
MSWTDSNLGAGGFSTRAPFRAHSANVGTNNVAAQAGVAGSLHGFYKDVIALRKSRPSLMTGRYAQPQVAGRVMSFQRIEGSETSVVAFNYGSAIATANLTGLPANAVLRRLWPAGGANAAADAAGAAQVPMAARSFTVFAVQVP